MLRTERSWPRVVALLVAAVGLLAATIGVLAGTGSSEDVGAPLETTTPPPTTGPTTAPALSIDDLTGSARELAELLATGREQTYHARYTGTSTDASSGSLVLESWADGGRFRQDTVVDVAAEKFRRTNLLLGDRGVVCTRLGDQPWSCEEVDPSEVQGSALLSGRSLDQLRRSAIGEVPAEVDGRPARCFTITYDAQTTELCVSPEGIPLRIRSRASELVLELLEHAVDDAVFEPPADPGGGQGPG